jgi:hypothetical protein
MLARQLSAAAAVALLVAGCADQTGYQKAFSEKAALIGNSHSVSAPADLSFRTTKVVLVRQGFTIEQADMNSGLIKAVRDLQDPDDQNVSYNITATADVTGGAAGGDTVVTLSASQQTVLHREWRDWWHLLWIIPLFPIGTEYQTVVTKEGNITDVAFYQDFFNQIDKTLEKPVEAAAPPFAPAAATADAAAPTVAPADATAAPAASAPAATPPAAASGSPQ